VTSPESVTACFSKVKNCQFNQILQVVQPAVAPLWFLQAEQVELTKILKILQSIARNLSLVEDKCTESCQATDVRESRSLTPSFCIKWSCCKLRKFLRCSIPASVHKGILKSDLSSFVWSLTRARTAFPTNLALSAVPSAPSIRKISDSSVILDLMPKSRPVTTKLCAGSSDVFRYNFLFSTFGANRDIPPAARQSPLGCRTVGVVITRRAPRVASMRTFLAQAGDKCLAPPRLIVNFFVVNRMAPSPTSWTITSYSPQPG